MQNPLKFFRLTLVVSFLALLFCPLATYSASATVVGYWQTLNEQTQQPDSVIHIWQEKGEVMGKVVKLYDNPQAVCAACGGELHNKPILGMKVLWGFAQDANGANNGKILAIKKGVVFDGNINLIQQGQQLQLIVKTPFGKRTQVWQRVAKPA